MSIRADNEPEYIDDDEYFDAEAGGSGSRRSNVLGGSGSFRDSENDDNPPEDAPISRSAHASGDQTRKRPKRAAASARRNKAKPRNPAPSVASSEERRARLAGKKPGTKARDAQRRQPKDEPSRQTDEPRRESPFDSLRARLRPAKEEAASKSERETSRFSAIAGGISGGISNLRGRLAGMRDQADTSGERRDADSGRPVQASGPGKSTANIRPGAGFTTSASRAADEASRESLASRAPRIDSAGWLDLDRKLDLIGVGLVFGAIVFFFSALSAEQAAISSVNTVIGQALGWGAVAVPVTMFATGLWLIVRHFGEEAPMIDPVRLAGIALAFLAVLVCFQFIESINYATAMPRFDSCRNPSASACVDALVQHSYQVGRGGGLLGGWLYSALVNNLTELGGFVMMLMVMTFSAMMITRSSMAELAVVAIGVGRGMRTRISQHAAKRRAARLEAQRHSALGGHEPHVRVSKPAAAQLTGQSQDPQALPEPREDTMPVPRRFRDLFGLRARFSAAAVEALPLAAATAEAGTGQNFGVVGRLFGRILSDEDPPPQQPKPEPSAGALERFLNLGDDLPFQTHESPVWQKPARPPSALPPDAAPPPASDQQATHPKPAMPERVKAEPPSTASPRAKTKQEDSAAAEADVNSAPSAAPPDTVASAPPATQTELARSEANDDSAIPPAHKDDAPAPPNDAPAPELPITSDLENGSKGDERIKPSVHRTAARSMSTPRPRIEWQLPDYRELLNSGAEGDLDREPLMRQAQIIEDTLASFGAPGRIVEINSGPVITQYGIEPAYLTSKTGKQNRVKVGAIAKLDKDLQLALGAKSIRVEAPVPGKGYVGIEVPNPDSARVSLRDVMASKSYRNIETPLAIALGVSVDGSPVSGDLTQMPHLLIAGTTGSGKSVCVNAIINSIIANNSPDVVKFIMVDPKRVELTGYNGLPHLVAPVVVELERTIGVLRWVTTEMDARYKKFSQAGARNIVDYNSILDPNLAPMPYIVVIIDELADLMMMAPDDTERAITRIAALARATGIHLVIATQRPSVDVVTGLIKANCPARIAFAVAGSVDSRVILDQPGAERLLGKGDMLYLSGNSPAPLRMQGVHVSNEEISRIIRYWKLQAAGIEGVEPIPLPALPPDSGAKDVSSGDEVGLEAAQAAFWDMSPTTGKTSDGAAGDANADEDELYQTAVDMVRRLDKASISLMQRRLRIGYTRAARLMDLMEERGVVGPPKEGSSKPRDVLPE